MRQRRERLLNKKEIAELLSTTPRRAERVLLEQGVYPVCLGETEKRPTKRWLASAVESALLMLHADAQPPDQPNAKPKSKKPKFCLQQHVNAMTGREVYELTQSNKIN